MPVDRSSKANRQSPKARQETDKQKRSEIVDETENKNLRAICSSSAENSRNREKKRDTQANRKWVASCSAMTRTPFVGALGESSAPRVTTSWPSTVRGDTHVCARNASI